MKPEERYVRMCEDHNVEVREEPPAGVDLAERNAWGDALWCPGRRGRGGRAHPVTTWVNFDRQRGEVLDRASVKKGHETEVRRKAQLEFTAATRGDDQGDRHMPKGIPGSGPSVKTKAKLLESRRYVAGDETSLRIQMRAFGGKDPASLYRIVWEHSTRHGKTIETQRGTVAIASTEDDIREAFSHHLAGLDKRWTPAPSSHLKLAPIPAPPKGR